MSQRPTSFCVLAILTAFVGSDLALLSHDDAAPPRQSVFVVALAARGADGAFRACPSQPVSSTSRPPRFPGPELAVPAARLVPGGVVDVPLRDEVLEALNKQSRLSLAPTLEAADLVLIVQASYAAYYHEERALPEAARPRSTPPPPRPFPLPWPDHSEPAPAPPLPEAPDNPFGRSGPSLSINKMIPDMPPNTRMSLLAVAVPASVYRRAPGDVAALLAAQVWEGWDQVPIRKGVIGRLSADPLVRSFAKGRDEAFTPDGRPIVEESDVLRAATSSAEPRHRLRPLAQAPRTPLSRGRVTPPMPLRRRS